MAVTDGYHPRAVAMVAAFGPGIRRASLVGIVAGIAAGIATALLLPLTLHGLVAMAMILATTVAVGTVVAIVAFPSAVRRAYEVYSWLGHREMARFNAATASRVPVGIAPVRDWLAQNPFTPATGEARVELLVAIGQFGQARTEFAALKAPTDDETRLARASLRTYGELVETGEVDLAAFDAVAATLPAGSETLLEATVVRALAVTRRAILRGEPDPLQPLRDLRPRLGRAATIVMIQDTWLPYARSLADFGLFLGVIAAIVRFGWLG